MGRFFACGEIVPLSLASNRAASPAIVDQMLTHSTLDQDIFAFDLKAIWNGRGVIVFLAFLTTLIGAVYAYRIAVPLYRTHSVVMLDPQEQTVIDLGSILPSLSREETVVTTQVEVLRSRRLIEKLAVKQGLLADPEFNPYRKGEAPFSARKWLKDKFVDLGLIRREIALVPNAQTEMDMTVNALLRSLTITNLPNSLIFSISAETRNPEKSSAIANQLAALYIDDQLAAKQEATERATTWLSGRVAELQAEFETAEHAAQSLRSAIDPDASTAMTEIERRLAALHLRLDADGLSPDAKALLLLEEAALADQLTDISTNLINLRQFEREAEASRLIYEYFLGRLKETAVQQGVQQPDARLISRAIVPIHPAAPKKFLILALSAIIGAGLGVALVMARQRWYTRIRTAEQLETSTGLPVLGQIPQHTDKTRNVIDYVLRKPSSLLAESVRDLRTSILLSNADHAPRVIAVTSSVPHEGKSTTSIMLAQNMAAWGKKVLLIEADIRRQTFEQYFGTRNRRGILSVLAGICDLEEAIFRPDGMSIDVLFGESSSTNAADIFATERYSDFIRQMRQRYDYIVVDTPPVLVVSDARVVAPSADAVVYAVHWNQTKKSQVKRGLQMFRTVNVPVAGLVLTRIDQRKMERYGYGREYGNYARKSQYYNT